MIVQALSGLVTEAMRDAHTKSVAVRACLTAMNHCCLVACSVNSGGYQNLVGISRAIEQMQ